MDKTSYTSAGRVPWKIMGHCNLLEAGVKEGRIVPIHAQFLPTNRCNLNCAICSCGKRDKKLEMSLEDAKTIIWQLGKLGCKAATITGGGEPLLHPQFDKIVRLFPQSGIKIGLTTNGLKLIDTPIETLKRFTWIRISNDDSRAFTDKYQNELALAVHNAPSVDWAFSHVVGEEPNFDDIIKLVKFANVWEFTHVRLVADLFKTDSVCLGPIQLALRSRKISEARVIYQGRTETTQGSKHCRIGYLKPLIGPDCKVYACCGVQYALDPPSYDLESKLCLGSALNLEEIYNTPQVPIDGSICKVCHYSAYNEALEQLVTPHAHEDFV